MELTKIIVRYADGWIIKGYTHNFSPDKSTFRITPVDPKVSNGPIEVHLKDVKGIFFVRDFMGNGSYREQKTFPNGAKINGRKVEVTFKDKEVMIGSFWGYDPNCHGFFLYPSDPNSNNLKVFIVYKAVSKINYPS
jgi:hypothetical protein